MTKFDPDRRQFLQAAAAVTTGLSMTNSTRAADDKLPFGIVDVIDSDPATGMSRAVVVGNVPLVHTGQMGTRQRAAASVREATPPELHDATRLAADLAWAIKELTEVLKVAGSSLPEVVKFNFYVAHPKALAIIGEWLQVTYPTRYRPAVSFVVNTIVDRNYDSFVLVDCVAVRREPIPFGKVLRFENVDAAVLPPTHKLYVSGDAAQGPLMSVVAETLQSLEKTLTLYGLDWSHVVQMKTFLQPIILAGDVLREIRTVLGERPLPVPVFVEWQSSEKVPLEIELIVAVPPELSNAVGTAVEYLNPPHKPGNAVFSRAVRVRSERTLYVSGLYGEPTDADGQVRDILRTLQKTVERGGGDLNHLVKATYYVSDDATSKALNVIRPEFYDPQRPPAASKAKVVGTGREEKGITLDMIAVPKS